MFSIHLRVAVLAVLTSTTGLAAELRPVTLQAWNAYIAHQESAIRLRAAQPIEPARNGEVSVAPFSEPNPIRVPGGLIHHWIGTIFIPDATIDDVLAITRDYKHYKDYYKPGVAAASVLMTSPDQDKFTLTLVNPSVVGTIAIVGTYVSHFFRLSDTTLYSTSETTSMCDHGAGYIWRLYSTARMDERDGGVLLQVEAIALSRDIPFALRWFVDPIVRRVSRESLEKSLQETSDAVRDRVKACEARNQIIDSGTCSHATNPGLRAERLPVHTSR